MAETPEYYKSIFNASSAAHPFSARLNTAMVQRLRDYQYLHQQTAGEGKKSIPEVMEVFVCYALSNPDFVAEMESMREKLRKQLEAKLEAI